MDYDRFISLDYEPPYEVRFIKDSEKDYVSECWRASRAYARTRTERLAYVMRHFLRKYPQYEGRRGGVYKDVTCLLEYA